MKFIKWVCFAIGAIIGFTWVAWITEILLGMRNKQ